MRAQWQSGWNQWIVVGLCGLSEEMTPQSMLWRGRREFHCYWTLSEWAFILLWSTLSTYCQRKWNWIRSMLLHFDAKCMTFNYSRQSVLGKCVLFICESNLSREWIFFPLYLFGWIMMHLKFLNISSQGLLWYFLYLKNTDFCTIVFFSPNFRYMWKCKLSCPCPCVHVFI